MELISVISAIVAVIAAIISYRSLDEQRRLTIWTITYKKLGEAENMFTNHPSLLEFHGITEKMLKELNVTVEEVVYVLQNFRAGQEYTTLKKKEKQEFVLLSRTYVGK